MANSEKATPPAQASDLAGAFELFVEASQALEQQYAALSRKVEDLSADLFQANGGSMIMLAKGNRTQEVTNACAKHGGFYLGSIGGPAARLAMDCIKKVEVIDFPENGMEAVWKIEVEDFPAFIVVDDKGNDFYAQVRAEASMPVSLA